MKTAYVLEYKSIDSKGREKNSVHAGVYKSLQEIDKKKEEILNEIKNKISFQIYAVDHYFHK